MDLRYLSRLKRLFVGIYSTIRKQTVFVKNEIKEYKETALRSLTKI